MSLHTNYPVWDPRVTHTLSPPSFPLSSLSARRYPQFPTHTRGLRASPGSNNPGARHRPRPRGQRSPTPAPELPGGIPQRRPLRQLTAPSAASMVGGVGPRRARAPRSSSRALPPSLGSSAAKHGRISLPPRRAAPSPAQSSTRGLDLAAAVVPRGGRARGGAKRPAVT